MVVEKPLLGIQIPGKFTHLKNTSFLGRKYKDFIGYKGSFASYHQFVSSRPIAAGGHNAELFNRYLDVEAKHKRAGFSGGEYKDLITPVKDFTEFNEQRKTISQNKLWKNIVTQFSTAMVRRRVRSEYDGEFDYDKRYDIAPFSQRSKAPQTRRSVKLFMESSFSCHVKAETITQYGCFVAAIVNLLEANGTNVELVATYTSTGFLSGIYAASMFRFEQTVKQSDEYVPLGQLLRLASGVYYRRAIFSLIVLAAEYAGHQVSEGLGSPYQFGKCWERKDGNLYIYSVPKFEQQEQILTELAKVIGI